MVVIDTVLAEDVLEGDYISIGEHEGEVLYPPVVCEDGAYMIIISDEEFYGEAATLYLDFDDPVDLLGE